MMDIQLRDVLYVSGMIFSCVGLYVALVQRLTRLEALILRVEKVEQAVSILEQAGIETLVAEVTRLRAGGDRRAQT